ncbi:MAG: hypothetical protein JSV91_07020 [Phycisphaerales bacterium]|nr:MAG: hypothetical protein JSV91_07020 [Phycisphaerales bacterium]
MLKYHHLGIPTSGPRDGEEYPPGFMVHVRPSDMNQCGIEWMRFEPDCPLPELVKTVPHVAFEVDDLHRELVGKEILIAPNRPSQGVKVAFVVSDSAPVEFLQFDER